MSKPDIIDEIINTLDPEMVPSEYIILAKVYTHYGEELILTAEQLEEMLENNPEKVANVKIILDVRKIRKTINAYTDEVFAVVKQKLLK